MHRMADFVLICRRWMKLLRLMKRIWRRPYKQAWPEKYSMTICVQQGYSFRLTLERMQPLVVWSLLEHQAQMLFAMGQWKRWFYRWRWYYQRVKSSKQAHEPKSHRLVMIWRVWLLVLKGRLALSQRWRLSYLGNLKWLGVVLVIFQALIRLVRRPLPPFRCVCRLLVLSCLTRFRFVHVISIQAYHCPKKPPYL